MSVRWFHIVLLIAVGIALDYWMPSLANNSLGKLGVSRG